VIRLLSDENFNGEIIRGLLFRQPHLDLVRVQDVGLQGVDDPEILAWAAAHGYILLTHDRATMPDFAFSRIAKGKPMAGMFVLNDRVVVREAIDEVLMIVDCSDATEWIDRVIYLPL
jgi:predicted nuclease of predicted toxin-antitoxin system